MSAARRGRAPSSREIAGLRVRLADAEETLRAIRAGEVDAVVVAGSEGPRVFTLQGADQPYRAMIEAMNEGALTLARGRIILYANRCFAEMVKVPLERLLGTSLDGLLSVGDRARVRALLKRARESGVKTQALLRADDGSQVPVQISARRLSKRGPGLPRFGLVVTDMTGPRRSEEQLRRLTHRLIESQEDERRRVALELHDDITQRLCGLLLRSQALADTLLARDGSAAGEALKLRTILGETAQEVERISRALRPSVLDQLGLAAVLRSTSADFSDRTGVPVKLACPKRRVPLPPNAKLALYRILQEALRNVEKHANARQVSVCLRQKKSFVELAIHDDGIGLQLDQQAAGGRAEGNLGLRNMRERAFAVGGTLEIRSVRRRGTEIKVRLPLAPIPATPA